MNEEQLTHSAIDGAQRADSRRERVDGAGPDRGASGSRGPENADTLGADGRWFDPLWREHVALTGLEQELLRTWWVRRLAFVSHAGAASLTTTQTYTRLEHSLGTLALVARFAPHDSTSRATALLHDIGHLPFSHTLEGLAGLDHHTLGRERIRQLDPVLERHGLSADSVIAMDEGRTPSPLRPRSGGMKLDHLDSFVRSGQAHGRTAMPPPEILARCRLVDGAVDTDHETARELTRLVVDEARAQRSAPNIVPVAVLRDLVVDLFDDTAAAVTPSDLQAMTEDELWSALLTSPTTSVRAGQLRRDPGAWQLLDPGRPTRGPAGPVLEHVVERGYLSLPTVDGRTITDREVRSLEDALPLRSRIGVPVL